MYVVVVFMYLYACGLYFECGVGRHPRVSLGRKFLDLWFDVFLHNEIIHSWYNEFGVVPEISIKI